MNFVFYFFFLSRKVFYSLSSWFFIFSFDLPNFLSESDFFFFFKFRVSPPVRRKSESEISYKIFLRYCQYHLLVQSYNLFLVFNFSQSRVTWFNLWINSELILWRLRIFGATTSKLLLFKYVDLWIFPVIWIYYSLKDRGFSQKHKKKRKRKNIFTLL